MKPANKASLVTGAALIALGCIAALTGHFLAAILFVVSGGPFLTGSAELTIITKDAQ